MKNKTEHFKEKICTNYYQQKITKERYSNKKYRFSAGGCLFLRKYISTEIFLNRFQRQTLTFLITRQAHLLWLRENKNRRTMGEVLARNINAFFICKKRLLYNCFPVTLLVYFTLTCFTFVLLNLLANLLIRKNWKQNYENK